MDEYDDVIYVNKALYNFMFKRKLFYNEVLEVIENKIPLPSNIGLEVNDFNSIDGFINKFNVAKISIHDGPFNHFLCELNERVAVNILDNIDNFIDKAIAFIANNRDNDYKNEDYICFKFNKQDNGLMKLSFYGFNILGRKKRYLIFPTDTIIMRYYELTATFDIIE